MLILSLAPSRQAQSTSNVLRRLGLGICPSTSHSHTHMHICTCCCDQTKGTQAQDFSCSFSDSLSDSLSLIAIYLYTLTITHSHTLPITCTWCHDEIKGTQDKDFSCSFSDSLYLSLRFVRTKEATLVGPVGLTVVGFEIESREVVVDCIGWHQWHGRGDQRVEEIMQSERQRSGAQNLVRVLDIPVMCVVCTRTQLLWNKHWSKILPGSKETLW